MISLFSVKIYFRYISNFSGHSYFTNVTDGWTDRQTDRRYANEMCRDELSKWQQVKNHNFTATNERKTKYKLERTVSVNIAHFSEIFTENSEHVGLRQCSGNLHGISENVLECSVNIHGK